MKGYELLSTPLSMAKNYIKAILKNGSQAIDATVGNGHDTLFLASLVGEDGCVYGFDIQEAALEKAKKLVGDDKKVKWILASHADMLEYCEKGSISAIMFNLGYLPGGDHELTTKSASTKTALEAAIQLLSPNGIVTIVVYPGHPAGLEEKKMLDEWLPTLDDQKYSIVRFDFINRRKEAPFLIIIEKRCSDD